MSLFSKSEKDGAKEFTASWTSFQLTWLGIGLASVAWWAFESQGNLRRFILMGGLSLAAFTVGSMIGFLFSSHSEQEKDTIAKVRDWVIGGVTTLTITKASSIIKTINTFAMDTNAKDPGGNEYAIAFGAAVAYAGLGFLFMFFLRELYYNPRLAMSRKESADIESGQAEVVQKNISIKLPPNILTGGDSVSDITNAANRQAAEDLKGDLYLSQVTDFLQKMQDAADSGGDVDVDNATKAANIHYYRTYFEEADKAGQARRALMWIQRVLLFNPHNPDMTTKYADMLAVIHDYAGAINILQKMVTQADAPLMVRQWLGYFLLFIPGHAAEAIRYSQEFRQLVGEDTDALFNIACAYAQAFCAKPGAEPGLEDQPLDHQKALDFLKLALQREPDYAEKVRTNWIKPGESFECFAQDPDFQKLVGMTAASKTP